MKNILPFRSYPLDYITGFCGLTLALVPVALNDQKNFSGYWIFSLVGLIVATFSAISTLNKMISPWLDSVYLLAGLLTLLTLEEYYRSQMTPLMWVFGILGLTLSLISGYNLFFSDSRNLRLTKKL
jgi:hypothetical protein